MILREFENYLFALTPKLFYLNINKLKKVKKMKKKVEKTQCLFNDNQ